MPDTSAQKDRNNSTRKFPQRGRRWAGRQIHHPSSVFTGQANLQPREALKHEPEWLCWAPGLCWAVPGTRALLGCAEHQGSAGHPGCAEHQGSAEHQCCAGHPGCAEHQGCDGHQGSTDLCWAPGLCQAPWPHWAPGPCWPHGVQEHKPILRSLTLYDSIRCWVITVTFSITVLSLFCVAWEIKVTTSAGTSVIPSFLAKAKKQNKTELDYPP